MTTVRSPRMILDEIKKQEPWALGSDTMLDTARKINEAQLLFVELCESVLEDVEEAS